MNGATLVVFATKNGTDRELTGINHQRPNLVLPDQSYPVQPWWAYRRPVPRKRIVNTLDSCFIETSIGNCKRALYPKSSLVLGLVLEPAGTNC
ncbi:MAG: hypothetical protein DMG12_25415 [Acidobacteria bacterium]|nr:MAG: hypothetical protein DMG12_25415 [Acidobacteriota bacterium]